MFDITTFDYDVNGNRTRITDALGHSVQLFDHNGLGQPRRMIDANAVTTRLSATSRGWLETVTVEDPSGDSGLNSVTRYTYDAIGQIDTITRPTMSR